MSARIGADSVPASAASPASTPTISPVNRTRLAKITVTTVLGHGHVDDTVR